MSNDDYKRGGNSVFYEEGLPFPYVKYSWGNWIIEFGDSDNNFKVCDCFEKPIKNYIESLINFHEKNHGEGSWERDYNDGRLGTISSRIYKKHLKGFDFEPHICHRCNNKIPSVEFCHPMYGGKFKRTYGWYIERRLHERIFDIEIVDEYDKLEEEHQMLCEKRMELINKHSIPDKVNGGLISLWLNNPKISNEIYDYDKRGSKIKRKLDNIVENMVRGEFGYKPIGEMWVNETIIFKIVKELFPKSEVIHHYRGSELEGLEIDVFIKDKKIGIEYNGKQHYKSIKHFGGDESLRNTKERDNRKLKLCKKLGIDLHIIKYTEVVSVELIKSKLGLV